jgi:hypothetical protein
VKLEVGRPKSEVGSFEFVVLEKDLGMPVPKDFGRSYVSSKIETVPHTQYF